MNAGEVIEIAREWVEVYGSQIPGFCGAHLMGGLNYAAKDASFPAYKDVDMNIVLQGSEDWDVHDLNYKGLILEYGSVGVDAYRSPETVLADPRLASNLAVNSILSDPTGMLASLHEVVAKEYPRRQWVQARCDDEKSAASKALEDLSKAGSSAEALLYSNNFGNNLAGLVAAASLKPPTHRRGLILMKELLATWGRPEIHEETLNVLGYASLSRMQVESFHRDSIIAFDRAVEVCRSPVPYRFKLHTFVRPYFVEGVQEMIDEGNHREAMYWTMACLFISNNAIQADAPESEKSRFQARFDQIVAALGWKTPGDIASRCQQAAALKENLFQAADFIMSRNPEII
jgi:hypothetical protein